MLTRLITSDTRIKVSSTLDKSLGKSCLVDGSPETCWTSQQGLPQFIQLTFPSPVVPKRLSLTFQGGFVGTSCLISRAGSKLRTVYPEDANRAQTFDLSITEPVGESSDFFGRVTVYDLMVEGQL
ncbi:hypothetical protein EDB83DRAFT_2503366 [Lactarius deliciosus]|nr:hypothetical protein EDB83DRAFT_2503366 [Lactarius deliciosus]